MNRKFTLGLVAVAVAVTAHASTIADEVLGTLYAMRGVYRSGYAPADWKKQHAGYDLEAEFNRAVQAVQSHPNLTVAESRAIFKQFIYSMKDYHTSIQFALTEQASLPLTIKGTENRFFVAFIDRAKLSERAFPFKVGDEVVTMDGQPLSEVVAKLQAEIIENVPETDKALAEVNLTNRRAARGISVPQGPVVLGLKAKGSDRVREVQLLWDYTPERVAPRSTFDTRTALGGFNQRSIFRPIMDVELANETPTPVENPFAMGSRKTFTPDLGVKVWETPKENAFHAYIYKAPDRRLVGYVRIPGYIVPDYKKAVTDFAAIVKQFEETTDAMVIDQVNNPGGSVFYLYSLVSMLADQPMKTPRHRMSVSQNEVTEAVELINKLKDVKNDEDAAKALEGQDFDGYPATYQVARFTLAYAEFIVDEWNAGRKLTRPYWIAGVDQINPAPVHYTKPILVLVNHLDFSGGDFFPGILQDNKRVTVMGTRTAGAGGYVQSIKIPNGVGVASFRTTGSLAERVSGNPLENLGVTPDVPYEFTAEDYQNNFAPYVKAVNAAVTKIAP